MKHVARFEWGYRGETTECGADVFGMDSEGDLDTNVMLVELIDFDMVNEDTEYNVCDVCRDAAYEHQKEAAQDRYYSSISDHY